MRIVTRRGLLRQGMVAAGGVALIGAFGSVPIAFGESITNRQSPAEQREDARRTAQQLREAARRAARQHRPKPFHPSRHHQLQWGAHGKLGGTQLGVTVNDGTKTVVVAALADIPEVGFLLSALTDILWPNSQDNPWEQMENQVEALINQKLSDFEYSQIQQDLAGLIGVMDNYAQAASDSQAHPETIVANWIDAYNDFALYKPHFQASGYEVLLLPLLAQFANLHLALLRDGVLFGKSWGQTDQWVSDKQAKLVALIQEYVAWAKKWYDVGASQVPAVPKDNSHWETQQWQAWNAYARQMTLNVSDTAYYWPYFDPSIDPGDGVLLRLTREIISDPEGDADDEHGVHFTSHPAGPITGIIGMAFEDIGHQLGSPVEAMQIYYADQPGPLLGFVGTTAGASLNEAVGSRGRHGPITEAFGFASYVPLAVQFRFQDGITTPVCGQRNPNNPGGTAFSWKFDGEILSYVTIVGYNHNLSCADCILFGFRYADGYDPTGIQPPATSPNVDWWAQTSPYGKWKAGTQVRYAVSFVTPKGETDLGPWTGWGGTGYALGHVIDIATDPSGQATSRNIYRQFPGGAPEFIGTLANNTDTQYQDENS